VKRIFYYSGYRLTVFHWQDNECIATYSFNPGDEGLDKFSTYLRSTENTPVRILVDLIEEDFKKESIPHVGAADRKAIVSRIIDRQYRKNTDFATYRVVEREKSGRKDDIILYSVLSNPEILDPWLAPIKDAGIAIAGIWSLPLLTPKLFNNLKIKSNNVLLVSQQVPSNLRQTFIKNGKFESSRSAVVNLDDASIGEYISTEVEQTIRFLSNQRHIGFDEQIEIHVMCRKADIAEIKSQCIDTNLRVFHYHELKELENSLNCNIQSAEYTNGIYSYVCANQIIPIGDYGNNAIFTKYYEQLSSKALYALSVILLLAATIFSFSFISESIIQDEEAITLRKQAEVIENNYQKKLASMEPRLKQAESMQSTVLLVDNIKSNRDVSPLNFMAFISRIMAQSGMHAIEITALSWKQNQSLTFPATNTRKIVKHNIDYGKNQPINQVATISGYIPVSKYDLKESVAKVNLLAKRLDDHELIFKTNIKRLPIDTRPEASIDVEIQKPEKFNNTTDKQSGQFEIELIMLGNKS